MQHSLFSVFLDAVQLPAYPSLFQLWWQQSVRGRWRCSILIGLGGRSDWPRRSLRRQGSSLLPHAVLHCVLVVSGTWEVTRWGWHRETRACEGMLYGLSLGFGFIACLLAACCGCGLSMLLFWFLLSSICIYVNSMAVASTALPHYVYCGDRKVASCCKLY